MIDTIDGGLTGINQKDEKSWEMLYNTYYVSLCVYTKYWVGDEDNAKDIVQDVLIEVWNSKLYFSTTKELLGYLYKAVYHRALSHIRNQKRRNEILNMITKQEEECGHVENDRCLLGAVQEEIMRLLYIHIRNLPEMRRKIVELSIKGFSNQEIANDLGIALNTVKVQKNRSLRYLREKLVKVDIRLDYSL